MRMQRLFWRLFFSHLVLIVLGIVAMGWLADHAAGRLHVQTTRTDLEARARLVRPQVAPGLAANAGATVDSLCKALGAEVGTRITVVRADGRVLGDSEQDPAAMALHAGGDRPEIEQALRGGVGSAIRYSETLRRNMLYVALPIKGDVGSRQQIIGLVRTALPLAVVQDMLRPLYVNVVVGASIAAVLFALVSLWLARRISLPLEELRRGAERFARGEFDRRLPLPALDEVRVLADSMNHMAAQLAERLTTVTQQRNELATILRSMSEGVLAVDSDRRVVTMNDACARILDVEGGACTGRPIHETFRNASLQTLIDQVLQSTEPVEGEVVLRNGGERHVQVHGAVLRDPEAHERGAVLVLNDVTRLQRLETMRRDFVANVSHELKTPVTSIKAAIETLTEGGSGDPDASRRFLAIAARQVDRLEAIIEDLLRLSRLEDEAGRGVIELVPGPLDTVLAGAAQTCERLAREKEITLEVTCPPDARARMNAPLLENAVVNLVNNAIKYSAPGGRVTLAAAVEGPEVIVSVRDTGCGIDQRYHERIFERFFRVDRARSRELGGTGLGLAIVKHIVLAHGGRVSVDSTPGRGSVFTLSLPHA